MFKRVGEDAGWQAQLCGGCFSKRMFAVPAAPSHHALAESMFSEVYRKKMQLGHGNRPDSPFAYVLHLWTCDTGKNSRNGVKQDTNLEGRGAAAAPTEHNLQLTIPLLFSAQGKGDFIPRRPVTSMQQLSSPSLLRLSRSAHPPVVPCLCLPTTFSSVIVSGPLSYSSCGYIAGLLYNLFCHLFARAQEKPSFVCAGSHSQSSCSLEDVFVSCFPLGFGPGLARAPALSRLVAARWLSGIGSAILLVSR